MAYTKTIFFLSWFLILTGLPLFSLANTEYREDPLTIGVVQFEVSPGIYSSEESFRQAVEEQIILLEGADFIVFPEYTSVYAGYLFINRLSREEIGRTAPLVKEFLDREWGALAKKYHKYILAGTYYAAEGDKIYNRALIYGPEGNLFHYQDKVFLGAIEQNDIGLDQGKIDDAVPFTIKGKTFFLTICRDTYHEEWESIVPPVDLWIDIKANELPYTEEYYSGALPSRLPHSEADLGLTVSLTGTIGGYVFEGYSSLRNDDRQLRATSRYDGGDAFIFTLE
ncbi:MAG: hypothetical protein PQJ60_14380 [Spirochaetales bacterium]|nr:hypothetical protein [Spirochaetales bacterium]